MIVDRSSLAVEEMVFLPGVDLDGLVEIGFLPFSVLESGFIVEIVETGGDQGCWAI